MNDFEDVSIEDRWNAATTVLLEANSRNSDAKLLFSEADLLANVLASVTAKYIIGIFNGDILPTNESLLGPITIEFTTANLRFLDLIEAANEEGFVTIPAEDVEHLLTGAKALTSALLPTFFKDPDNLELYIDSLRKQYGQ